MRRLWIRFLLWHWQTSLYVISSYLVQEPVHLNNNTTSDPFSSNLNQYRAATHSSTYSVAQFTFPDSSKLFFLTFFFTLSSSVLPTRFSCFCFLLWKPLRYPEDIRIREMKIEEKAKKIKCKRFFHRKKEIRKIKIFCILKALKLYWYIYSYKITYLLNEFCTATYILTNILKNAV